MRSVYVYPSDGPADVACRREIVARAPTWRPAAAAAGADLAIAPSLRRVLPAAVAAVPALGTLILHPSLLPRRRGPDAVRWTVADGDPFSGVTWFWCAPALDTGDICEQEAVAVPPGITARGLYDGVLVPAAARALGRLLDQIALGYVRRVPQDIAAATTQSWHPSRCGRVA